MSSRPPLRIWLSILIALLLASTGFGQDADPARTRALIERLNADRPEDRSAAARDLKRLGPSILPALEKASRDERPELAERARQVLQAIRFRQSLSGPLLDAFPDLDETLAGAEDASWTRTVMEASRTKDGERLHPLLNGADLAPLATRAIRGASPEELSALLTVLGTFHVHEAAADVVGLLSSEEPDLRIKALYCLGWMGAAAARRDVERFLMDPDATVRDAALWALSSVGSAESLPFVRPLLESPRPIEVGMAARVLGTLDDQASIPAIRKLLGFPDPYVRAEAISALGALDARPSAPEIAALAADADVGVPLNLARALGCFSEGNDEETLTRLLGTSHVVVRTAAADALGRRGVRGSVPALAKLLPETSWYDLRCAITEALCVLGDRQGIEILLKESASFAALNALRNPEGWRRLEARKISASADGEVRSLLRLLAKEAGLVLQFPKEEDSGLEAALRGRALIHKRGRTPSLLSELRNLTARWGEFIVEERTLRILPRSAAAEFWKAWVAETQPR